MNLVNLTSGSLQDTPTVETAVVSPASNVVLVSAAIRGTLAGAPTISGLGLVWTVEGNIASGADRRLVLWKGTGTAEEGAVTISDPSITDIAWSVDEDTDGEVTGNVVQLIPDTDADDSTTHLISLIGAPNPANAGIAIFGQLGGAYASTPVEDSGWEELSNPLVTTRLSLAVHRRVSASQTAGCVYGVSTTGGQVAIMAELEVQVSRPAATNVATTWDEVEDHVHVTWTPAAQE